MGTELRCKARLRGHSSWVTCLYTLVNGADDCLQVLSGSTGSKSFFCTLQTIEYEISRHTDAVTSICATAEGKAAISSSLDGTVRIWNLETFVEQKCIECLGNGVMSAWMHNGIILSAQCDGSLKTWNYSGDSLSGELAAHKSRASGAAISPATQSQVCVSAGWDAVIKLWATDTSGSLVEKKTFIKHQEPINSVAISPDGSLLFSGGNDKQVELFDINAGIHLHGLSTTSTINCLAVNPLRYWICAATDDGISLWDLETKAIVSNIDAHHGEFIRLNKAPKCLCVAWSPDGNTLFSGWSDSVIRIWEVIT